MKDRLLDTPFEDAFEDFLEKGESIIWTGKPTQYRPFSRGYWLMSIGVFTYLTFYLTFEDIGIPVSIIPTIVVALSGIILHIIFTFLKNRKKEKVSYALSQKRIFFQFVKLNKTEIYDIPFIDIQNIQALGSSIYNNSKVIYIYVKNPAAIPFTTYSFDFNERRHQPTLELIMDADGVAKMIEEGIKKNKI